jgi:hypothetical protein
MQSDTSETPTLPQQGQAVATAPQVFTVGDAGRAVGKSPSTIRRLASELQIEPQRTANGTRIFDAAQVSKIASEVQRREREANR